MQQKGFTLIELLVAIAIIGLLASVVLISVNSSRLSARNTKRIADVQRLVTAFNLGIGSGAGLNNNGLPDTSSATLVSGGNSSGLVCVSSICTGGLSDYQDYPAVADFLAPFLKQYPTDPPDNSRGSAGYLFISNFGGGTGPAGNYIPPGGKIQYYLELQSNYTCGPGILWKNSPTTRVCILPIN